MAAKFLLIVFGLLCLSSSGCKQKESTVEIPADPNERTFATRGVIREIASDRQTAVIRHEEIPGYMPKMVMKLTVANPDELLGLKKNDEVTFLLHANQSTHWIDTIQRIGTITEQAAGSDPAPSPSPELKPGDLMPDFEMTTETGARIHLSDYRGQVVAFTFIFTRCPLPDYCPQMNRSFRQAYEGLTEASANTRNWQLLSISFDSEYDTPQVLANYAQAYRGRENDQWLFAVCSQQTLKAIGPPLDLAFAQEQGSFSHNLRTVVVSPNGKIHIQFDGNTWTPEALANAITEAATQETEDAIKVE